MIKVARWANENKDAAGAILNRQTSYLDAEDTYQGIKDVDMNGWKNSGAPWTDELTPERLLRSEAREAITA